MKKTLFLTIALCISPALVQAAQTPVTPMGAFPNPATASINTLKAATNTKLEVIEANRQDHVSVLAAKADKSSTIVEWAAWPNGTQFVANTIVSYQGSLYKCLQTYTKNAGDTPVTFTAYWAIIEDGGSGISDATSDSKTYGRKDSAWVEVLSASDVVTFTANPPLSYTAATGALSLNLATDLLSATITANDSVPSALAVKTLFNSLSITGAGFNPIYQTTDPVASDANGVYINKTTGHVWYIDDPGKTDISAGTFTAWDTAPATFGFNAVTNADAGITYWSDPYTVADIDRTSPISATAPYKINGGTPTTDPGFVSLNDTVSVSAVASTTPGATVTENATIGGVTGSPAFSVTTTNTVVKAYETETFTASNGVGITVGGLWTGPVAADGSVYDYLRIYNNAVVAAANRIGLAYRSNVSFSPNQKACATVVTAGTGGPSVRISTTPTVDTGYGAYADTANKYLIRRVVNGSATTLASPDVTMAPGNVVCLSASGSDPVLLDLTVNGTSIATYSDSSANKILTGAPGLRLKRATYDVKFDNWTGEDL